MNFVFFLFLSIHRTQQPRSRWPSDVFRRFGRRKSFNNNNW